MSRVRFVPIPTKHAETFWSGGSDAHDMIPEHHTSDGSGVPCRHCLQDISAGQEYLILAYRPFDRTQPYAEVGPIFLHAEPCRAYADNTEIPPLYLEGEPRLLKGYNAEDRIIYGTGKIVKPEEMNAYARELFDDPSVAYVHVRSSVNNCYACRIERAD